MSYLAISRKYRPATFAEIVGQEHVTRTLRNAIARERIHHGFLFTGARGVGKTTAARALSRALNCEQGPTPDPCGTCTSCKEISTGTSPDLIEIDGASNNSVEDIRDLRETVRYAPTRGGWKIYLVDEVHMLSKGAFNALLKTLEEPPPHVVFIFATTEPNRIPDTILSRVQRFDFKRIPVPAVVARLREIAEREGVAVSDNGLRMIARAGEGSMRDAESLLDQVIASSDTEIRDEQVAATLGLIDRGLLYDMLGGLVTGEPDRCLGAIEAVYGYGYELSQFTGEMLEVLRNATFLRLSPGARRHVDLSADELGRLDDITDGVPPDTLSRTFHAMLDVHDQVSRSERPRIVLEMAVARLATTRPLQPVGALLGRLDDLERRLRQGGANPPAPGMRNGRAPRSPRASRGGSDDDRRSRSRGPTPETVTPAHAPAPSEPARGRAVTRAPAEPVPSTAPTRTAPARRAAPSDGPPPRSAPARPPDGPPHRRAASSDGPPIDSYEGLDVAVSDDDPPLDVLPRDATPEQRWKAFCERLSAARLDTLTHGEPMLVPGMLRVWFKRARKVAEARRKQQDPRVDAALRACYPEGTTLEFAIRTPRGPDADALLREARADPTLRRIAESLGATFVKATPPDTDR